MNEIFVPAEIHRARDEKLKSGTRPFTGGPRPEALFITCSDCTLDKTLSYYFNDRPVFLLRTFGNAVDEYFQAHDELIEALEEAVCWWRVPQIIICGHSGCQAMQAPRDSRNNRINPSAPHAQFQSMLRRVGEANQNLARGKEHVVEQLAALRTYPFIENGIQEEELQLAALFYLHPSGLFLQYDEIQQDYRPL